MCGRGVKVEKMSVQVRVEEWSCRSELAVVFRVLIKRCVC
jgi:hypothetical protein